MDKYQLFSRVIGFTSEAELEELQNSSVLIAGIGGLGSVVAETLVRRGVGNLILIDHKDVDLPDLNRQTLYRSKDVGSPKLPVAKAYLSSIHPYCHIQTVDTWISDNNQFIKLMEKYSFTGIADCLDNFPSRFALEKLLKNDHFLVHGGVKHDFGQITTIDNNRSLKKLYEQITDDKNTIPVGPEIVNIIGSLMANEIVANITGQPKLMDKLLIVELSDFSQFKIDIDLRK